MAVKRKKIPAKKAQKVQETVSSRVAPSMEKKYIQAVIGLFLVAVVGSLIFQALKNGSHPQTLQAQNIISPIPLHVTASVSATPIQLMAKTTGSQTSSTKSAVLITKDTVPVVPSATTATASALVKKLPFTASEPFSYTAREGDSVASIGKTFCGDERAYLQIIEDNNLTFPYVLQVGNQLLISCK